MTIAMPDSITMADLPAGYPAYLGYTDGRYDTAAELAARFPAAELVLLTVTGQTADTHGVRVASGADSEPGDLTATDAVAWVMTSAADGMRPVIYASIVGEAGYGMGAVLGALHAAGIRRQEVRLLSAHYGEGAHICGPSSCGLVSFAMDGTQWTDNFRTPGGRIIDMSMLADDFFGPPQTETERLVQELGIVKMGDRGESVKTVQGLCNARTPVAELTIDGVFGARTLATVRGIQADARLTVDGVVGPQTWPVLLGVA